MARKNPEWFELINAWLNEGHYGLTLPFLVGAIAYHRDQEKIGRKDIESLLKEMITNPVNGYIVHVRWCLDYGSAVFAVYEKNSPHWLYERGVEFKSEDHSEPSLIIERNLAAEWKVSYKQTVLLAALVQQAEEPVVSGNVSRYWTEDGVQYIPLQEEDKEFIQDILGKQFS